MRITSNLAIVCTSLECGDPIFASRRRQTFEFEWLIQSTVTANSENTYGANGCIEAEKVLPVSAHRDIEVDATWRIATDNRFPHHPG